MVEESIFRTIGNKDRLVDRVVNEIQNLIIENKLEPGMKLPPERDFAEQIGVSRTVVREAIQILEAKGLLEVKHGVGTIVCKVGGDQIAGPLNILFQTQGITLDNLHQVRSILEVEIAGIAAMQRTPEEVASLRLVLANLEANMNDPEAFANGDSAFHHAIAKLSHNPLLIMLLDSIGGVMREVRISVSNYPDLFNTVIPDHRQILASVEAKDPKQARDAMRKHLENARKIQALFLKDKESEEQAK